MPLRQLVASNCLTIGPEDEPAPLSGPTDTAQPDSDPLVPTTSTASSSSTRLHVVPHTSLRITPAPSPQHPSSSQSIPTPEEDAVLPDPQEIRVRQCPQPKPKQVMGKRVTRNATKST